MSLVMMALRISAVEALKAGGTLVGSNVLDSQISAIDLTVDGQLKTDQQSPFIAVYSEAANSDELGNSGLRANGVVELTFNCGIALTMWQTNKETGEGELDVDAGEWVQGFPATDANLEATLDVVGCQIARVLSDAENPWAQVFGNLCTMSKKSVVRSSGAAENVRLACGQVKPTVDAYADPAVGTVFAEGSVWPSFLALMEANGVAQLGLFRFMLGVADGAEHPDFSALTGMTVSDAVSLKLYDLNGQAVESRIETVISEVDRS